MKVQWAKSVCFVLCVLFASSQCEAKGHPKLVTYPESISGKVSPHRYIVEFSQTWSNPHFPGPRRQVEKRADGTGVYEKGRTRLLLEQLHKEARKLQVEMEVNVAYERLLSGAAIHVKKEGDIERLAELDMVERVWPVVSFCTEKCA
jgi:hypothetical protein